MFLTTGEGVIAVDAPPSIGENFLKAISETTDEPITHVIYSRSHADHIAAAGMFPNDATYIAMKKQRLHCKGLPTLTGLTPMVCSWGGSAVPMPTVTFPDKYTLTVGSQTLELEYRGPNHNPGNIFIYAPKQKMLLLIDVVFPGWSPFLELAITTSPFEYIKSHDDILSYDFDTLVSGHLGVWVHVRMWKSKRSTCWTFKPTPPRRCKASTSLAWPRRPVSITHGCCSAPTSTDSQKNAPN